MLSRNKANMLRLMGRNKGPLVYKHKKQKRDKDAPLEFRVWDGEGKNFPDGTHRMVLLSNSDEEYIYNENGLSTIECFKFLLQKRDYKINVWFSFGYDINKILTDIPLTQRQQPRENLERLWKYNSIYYKGFKIDYIPRKIFRLQGDKCRFSSADIFSFFQVSFLKACKQWGIDASTIEQGKQDRSIFDTYTFEDLLTYNFLELRYAKQLITKLYEAFKTANLVPRRWHGPGALAGTFFLQNKLGEHWGKEHALPEMEIPIRHAYFGGRIDLAYIGEIECHQYDLVSAYPYALTDCISLNNVFWHYNPYPFVDNRHALYHVVWDIPHAISWGPFPWRKENGTVLFPSSGEGWYWGVEVLAAEKLFGDKYIKRLGAYYPMCIPKYPFKDLIESAYTKRNDVGRKTGAGIAIKLLLNSLYGKLCQGIGIATWQNYIWAGYITSFTRAKMLDAIRSVGDSNVVAIATDGIYTKCPMQIEETGLLGSWEYEGFSPILFVGAGLYTVFKDGKAKVVKSRGMPANLNHGWVLRQWGCSTEINGIGEDSMTSHYTSFIGMGKAIHQNKPFGVFVTEEKNLEDVTMGGTSKRFGCISFLFAEGWKEMILRIRERPYNSSPLSTPYKKNKVILKEQRIENETTDN